jgi:hypothetical protein
VQGTLSPPVAAPPSPTPPIHRRRSHRGWIISAVLLVVVIAGIAIAVIPPNSPGHQFWINLTGGSTSSTGSVQQVIQRADSEQAQALASNDPSLMSDTATAAYYGQLVQINQQMIAQGVTGIQLTNLSWGPVTINGTTATATTYETWVTTFSDGTTSESTDTNNYSLAQQNGAWLIASDQQPGSPTAPGQPGGSATPQPQATPLPAVTTSAETSHNWSGYATTSGTFTGVTGTWTVPQPSSASSTSGATPGVGATWVGIGGVNSRDLIQAGTQDITSGGQHEFQAWIEMLPQASQQVPLAVAPGDSITVSIAESSAGSGSWQISMANNTSGKSFQTTAQYQSSESSAEWIEEAPAAGNGNTIVPLDNFGSVSFAGASAVENGQTLDMAQAGAQSITMLNSANQALAVPSSIGSDGSSFTVTRTSAPATTTPTGRGGRGASPPPARGR